MSIISHIRPELVSGIGIVPMIAQLGENVVGCELGICSAFNLRYFLDNLDNIKNIYAVDPWTPYDDWNRPIYKEEVDNWKNIAMENIQPYKDKVTVLEMTSTEAAAHIPDGSLDFIFIDGDHSYEAVARDLELYWPKVRAGGIFAGHDWVLPEPAGVQRAVTEFLNKTTNYTHVGLIEQNAWFCIR